MSAPASAKKPDVLAAFKGSLEPVEVPFLYQLGLAAAAAAMVLLPLLYVALIVGVGWLVYLHAVHNVAILSGGRTFYRLIAYAAPIVAGGILALFMVKPLFAKPAEEPEQTKLDEDDEPLLFAFVYKICELVGAPKPVEIRVDSQVNASASFRRGFLSLFGNDLVLTLGLPLVAGLRTDQLAGVIAHEFGHFAQGAGMRLSYVVRRVNFWFARVVYQRDEWDVRLDRWSQELDFRLAVVLWLAKLGVWVSRKILWALMTAGHGISSFLLRQMEFDADAYEAQLVGSKTFGETSVEIELLGLASQRAIQDLSQTIQDDRLVDDHAGLVAWRRSTLSADAPQNIRAALEDAETSAFDTHPATRDRIAAAEAANRDGVFHQTSPATVLFRDFDELSRSVTRRFYSAEQQLDLERNQLIPLAEFRRQAGDADLEARASAAVFGGALRSDAPLHVAEPAERPVGESVEKLRAAKQECERLIDDLADSLHLSAKADEKLATLRQADGLLRTGFRIDANTFGVPLSAPEVVDEHIQATEREYDNLSGRFGELDRAFENRLAAAQDLVYSGASWLEVEQPRERAERLRPALAALREAAPAYRRLKSSALGLQAVANNVGEQELNEEQVEALRNMASACAAAIREMRPKLAAAGYPFERAQGKQSLEDFLLPGQVEPGDFNAALNVGVPAYQNFESLYARIMGRWAAIVHQVEQAAFEATDEPG